VSGYGLGFEDPFNGSAFKPLCRDASSDDMMFRIVVKSNLTMSLAENLIATFEAATLPILDSMEAGFLSTHTAKLALRHLKKPRAIFECSSGSCGDRRQKVAENPRTQRQFQPSPLSSLFHQHLVHTCSLFSLCFTDPCDYWAMSSLTLPRGTMSTNMCS
jgi:hypothetical protein